MTVPVRAPEVKDVCIQKYTPYLLFPRKKNTVMYMIDTILKLLPHSFHRRKFPRYSVFDVVEIMS